MLNSAALLGCRDAALARWEEERHLVDADAAAKLSAAESESRSAQAELSRLRQAQQEWCATFLPMVLLQLMFLPSSRHAGAFAQQAMPAGACRASLL